MRPTEVATDFDEMLRLRNVRYVADTLTMLCALSERLQEGLRFEEFRKRLDRVVNNEATESQREELLAELRQAFPREAERMRQRIEVLRYLCLETEQRLANPDLQAIILEPQELPSPVERRSLPSGEDKL